MAKTITVSDEDLRYARSVAGGIRARCADWDEGADEPTVEDMRVLLDEALLALEAFTGDEEA